MSKTFVIDIQANQDIATFFVVADKQLRTARNGKPFLTLKLADKTGEIVGRIWERAQETASSIPTKGVVFVRGRSEKYREELQLQILEITPVALEAVERSDFLPVCPISAETLLDHLKAVVSTIKRRSLGRLMKHFLGDRELMNRFRLAPAAKSMHHAYLGGLLEHSTAVAALVSDISGRYPDLDRDLLIVGAVLHDVGKVDEFVYDLLIDYSHEGRLLGHVVLGVQIIEKKIAGLKRFPAEEALLLKHLILSHHGETEFGAVRLPMTREAFVLHFADDLDAKMNSLSRILSAQRDEGEAWTPYQQVYERFFFRGLPVSPESPLLQEDTFPTEGEPERDRATQLRIWAEDKKRKGGG